MGVDWEKQIFCEIMAHTFIGIIRLETKWCAGRL